LIARICSDLIEEVLSMYRQRFYHCILDSIKTYKKGTLFRLIWKETNDKMERYVDQSKETILDEMKEIVSGREDNKIFLTSGMTDIDMIYLGDNKWKLVVDRSDNYEFNINFVDKYN